MRRLLRLALVVAALVPVQAFAATPLLLYKMDQASSGTTPTTITDTSTGTALNLTHTYGGGSWTSIASGDGLTYTATAGSVSSALNGTKVATALAGSHKATIEVVADTTSFTGFNQLMGFSATGAQGIFVVVTAGAAVNQVGIGGAAGTAAWFDVTPGLHRFLAVQDTDQATAANRLLLYVDGSLAPVDNTPFAASYPTLSAAIDVGFTNYANNQITIGCLTSAAVESFVGPIYYGALYAAALTSGDATSHNTALASNNDADPNAGAAVAFNSLFFGGGP